MFPPKLEIGCIMKMFIFTKDELNYLVGKKSTQTDYSKSTLFFFINTWTEHVQFWLMVSYITHNAIQLPADTARSGI